MDRAAAFGKVVRHLPELMVTRYDRRGYGRSRDAGTTATVDEMVDDLIAVIGTEPVCVVGHSLGGVAALTAAERRPDLVRSVGAFEAPMAWTTWWPRSSAGNQAMALSSPAGGDEEVAERFMRRMIGDERWERLPARTREDRRREGPALVADVGAMRADAPYDPARLHVPVLAGHGSRARSHHRDAARRLAELVPDGELMVIEGAGHDAPLTHPKEFAAFVSRVVARWG
jgi:pimeloyl-ACP methyl ester carboxylesterase